MAPQTDPDSLLFFLDSSAIANGANLPPPSCRTTPSVVAEFEPGGATRRRLEQLLAAGMNVEEPSQESRARVETAAKKAGSLARLSRTDVDILALVLESDGPARLVTDDYTIQDVGRRLGLEIQSVATAGITAPKDWRLRCLGCGRWYEDAPKGNVCSVCGSVVKPKALRTKRRT